MKTKIKILHLEDSVSDALLINNVLKKENIYFEQLVVDTEKKFVAELTNFSPDIILADHSLPSFNSYDALFIYHSMGLKVPFIIITATMSEDFAVDILKKGAHDYILKDRLHRLPVAIENCLEKYNLSIEQKQAQEALEKNEKRYHALLENIADGIIILSSEGKPTFISSTVKKVIGYTKDEMMKLDISSLVHADNTAELLNVMEKVLANPGVAIQEHKARMLHKDGTWRWIEGTVTNVLLDPAINGIIFNFRDITDKKNLEDLLDKTNHLARIGNWELNLLNNTIYWSFITKELHEVSCGYIPDLETSIQFYKKGFSRNAIKYAVRDAIDNGTSYDLELQIVTAKGNERWFRVIGEPEMLNDTCVKLYGSFQDIDVSKRTEIKLMKAYEEKNTILESIGDGFYALDENWIFTYWNKGAEVFLGRMRDQVVGKNIWVEYPDIVNTIFYTYYQKAFKEKTIQQFEAYYETLNVWAEVSVYPSALGLSVYFRNITERKKAEELLRISKSNLRVIFENTDASIYSLDRNLRYVAFNKRLGKSLKEIYNLEIKPGDNINNFLEKLNPVETVYWQQKYSTALQGEVVKFEKEFYVQDRCNHISFSIHPVWENKMVIGLTCYAIDITKIKESENALRKSEAALAEAQHVAKYGNWNIEIASGNISWSQELYNVFGSEEDFFDESYESFLKLLDNEDREMVMRVTLQTRNTGVPFNINCRITTPCGTKRIIHALGYAKLDENGRTIRLYGTVQDVTEQKNAETELSELNAQLRNLSDHLQIVREEERTNIAREVHDELGQQMTSLKMDITWLQDMLTNTHPQVTIKLKAMLEMTNEAIRTIRRIVIELRPGILDDLGLEAALEWQAKEFENRNGLICVFNSSVQVETYSQVIDTIVFRIFQESLTNIIRHAHATHVVANLYEKDKSLLLEVMDNGIGISDERKNNKVSFGLMGMKERAAIIKGSFNIEKMNEQGTVVTLKIPL